MREGVKEHERQVQPRREVSERESRHKSGTYESSMRTMRNNERAQESMKVRNIHSRDKKSLSKQEGKCI